MNYSNPIQLQPQGQCPKPFDGLGIVGLTLEDFEKGLVLCAILREVTAKVAIMIVRVERVIRNRIEPISSTPR
jgi:hypothetical protein